MLKGSSERERERESREDAEGDIEFFVAVCVCVGVSMCFWVEPDIMSWGAVRTRELWDSRIS